MKSSLFRNFKLGHLAVMPVLLGVAFFIPTGQALASWTAPDTAPPGGNVAAPINTSATPQTKLGDLTVAGDFLNVSTGDLYIPTPDRGVFWSSSSDPDEPHINFDTNTLYVSPGSSGDHIELQGSVTITEASGTNLAGLSIQNSAMFNCSGLSTDAEGTLECGSAAGGHWTQDGDFLYPANANSKIGIGDTTPASPLTVGNGDQFQVDPTGNLIFIKGIPYNWPDSNPGNNITGYLKNDGNGNLSWDMPAGGGDYWKAGSTADTIAPTNPDTDKVAIGRDDIDDNTRISAKGFGLTNNDKTIYSETTNGLGYAGYFSGKTALFNGDVEIGYNSDVAVGVNFFRGGAVVGGLNTNNNVFSLYGGAAGANHLTIIDNGNVGIGVINPATRLEVQGGSIKATDGLIIQTVAADPASPAIGQMWLVTN